jgi:putative phosphonate metabolism protein
MLQNPIDTVSSPSPDKAALRSAPYGEPRYAIYFAPRPGSAWWRFGSAWLGRDAVTDAPVPRPAMAALDPAVVTRLTAMPRRYGFHATLKAPFRLKPRHSARDVYVQAANLAASCATVPLPPLSLRVIDDFVALGFVPGDVRASTAHALAAQCVRGFDHLRARPTTEELARRHAAGLDAHQSRLLAQWGYPYVFDEYRFHLTLTGLASAHEQAPVVAAVTPWIDTLNAEPLALDAIAVFVQPSLDAPFVVTRRYGFDGRVEIYRDDP